MAWPIDTRSERRDSGSALVESMIIPSQPSAIALRMIEPMLIGLSTASTSDQARRALGQLRRR